MKDESSRVEVRGKQVPASILCRPGDGTLGRVRMGELEAKLRDMADGFEVMAVRVRRGIVSKGSLAECLLRKSHELKRIIDNIGGDS